MPKTSTPKHSNEYVAGDWSGRKKRDKAAINSAEDVRMSRRAMKRFRRYQSARSPTLANIPKPKILLGGTFSQRNGKDSADKTNPRDVKTNNQNFMMSLQESLAKANQVFFHHGPRSGFRTCVVPD